MPNFLKFIPSEEALWLIQYKPKAFFLLTHIANTVRRCNGGPDGLAIGQCHLKASYKYGFTEGEYRAAKKMLVSRNHIKIIETNRTRKKSITGTTTDSTLVQLISSTIYDINLKTNDNRNDVRTTTERQQTRRYKNEKESHHPYPSSFVHNFSDDALMTDDFSSKIEIFPGVTLTKQELDACVAIKGDKDKVREAIEYIQASKKRKSPIADWPNALAKWKIENKTKIRLKDNLEFAEFLCKKYEHFQDGDGWRCRKYFEKKKDQNGILFESESAYQEAFFVPLVNGEFREKCDDFIRRKKMRRKK